MSLITSNLLFTILQLCPLSLPIYYLRHYYFVPYHFQFIFTLLPLYPLSLPIYYLRYYHSVPYHFNLFFTLLPLCPLSLPIYYLQIIWAKQSERFIHYNVKIQMPNTAMLQAFIAVTHTFKWPFFHPRRKGGWSVAQNHLSSLFQIICWLMYSWYEILRPKELGCSPNEYINIHPHEKKNWMKCVERRSKRGVG